jgi:hypothetical protein
MQRAEREMVARARHAFTRLVGLELGDRLADELWEDRCKRDSDTRQKDGDAKQGSARE